MAFSSNCALLVLISAATVANVSAVNVPALLHTAHRGQEALRLESGATSKCPQVKHPSLLFMHIEKTGGTVMRQMLHAALQQNMQNYHMVDGMVPGHLTKDTKKHNFVIGLVRRPCDYILSRYYMGLYTQTGNMKDAQKLGSKEDFKDLVSKITNETWMSEKASREKTTEKYWMSEQIAQRYGNKQNAHCWMRTHNLKADFLDCVQKFQACGGSVTNNGEDLANIVEAAMIETATDPSKGTGGRSVGNHPACTDMFDHEMMSAVLKTQQKVINEFDLGVCCSSDPKSLIRNDV